MFSFRDLVESMEKNKYESVKQKPPPIQPPLQNISSYEAHKDCEITPRSQASQCKVEATDEAEDGWERREGLWGCNESREDQEQERKGIWWKDEEFGVTRTGQHENDKMEIEATHTKIKDTEKALTLKRKQPSMTSGNSNCYNNLYAPLRKSCTLPGTLSPLPDLAHTEETLGKQNVESSNLKVRCSRGSGCEQGHNSDHDPPDPSSWSPSGDQYDVLGKLEYLGGSKRKVRGIDNQYRTAEERYSFEFVDETIEDCHQFGDDSLRKVADSIGSEGTSEEFTSQEFFIHASYNSRQYFDDVWHRGVSGKDTRTLGKHLGSNTKQAENARGCDLNCPVTMWPLNNTTSAFTPLIGDKQQTNSATYKNAACCDFQTKNKVRVEHKWTTQNSTGHGESQNSKDSEHVTSKGSHKPGKKESTRPASKRGRNSGIPSKQSTRGLSKKLDSAAYNKQIDRTAFKTNERPLNYKTRNIRKHKGTETKIGFHETDNKAEDTRGNEEPRSSSPSSLGFRCPRCSCWWRDEASLARHLRQHAPARPFACADCPSRFNQLVHLQIHRRTHSGEKPFRCTSCSASFSRKDRLRSHERRHSGEQPYTCPYCSLSFRDAASLRSHVPVHALQLPFTCRVCRSTFAHLSTFTSHWRQHK
ncbi:zinc finger protein 490-like [Eriocheir sinensis]|uniref:zinc finger protein 490-like n=1 Tax=Eriocheir sinensis TaxID=95602 RepID=UPI0021C7C275|nr:zinc finger protein 490-like [Eriocheir sinensis]